SSGMRARNFASRKLLVSSSPVEAQLSIQTWAISSYSSTRAGRIVGSVIEAILYASNIPGMAPENRSRPCGAGFELQRDFIGPPIECDATLASRRGVEFA